MLYNVYVNDANEDATKALLIIYFIWNYSLQQWKHTVNGFLCLVCKDDERCFSELLH